jgi:hypothetical protein
MVAARCEDYSRKASVMVGVAPRPFSVSQGGLRTIKPRVLYWTNIPSPYMVERFNVIARRANQGLCLQAGR